MNRDSTLVTVNILTYNKKDDLRKCLTSIRDQTYSKKEIIVIDNASVDGTLEMIEKEFTDVRFIRMPENLGIEGLNCGFANAKGEYIVAMDDDATLAEDWIELAVTKFEKDEKIGVIGSKVINGYTGGIEWYYLRPIEKWKDEEFQTVQFHGAAAIFRKSVLDRVGYYPKEYFIYQNEFALGAKILNAGYDILYWPKLAWPRLCGAVRQ